MFCSRVTTQPVVFTLKDSATVELHPRTSIPTLRSINELNHEQTTNNTGRPVNTLVENPTEVEPTSDSSVTTEKEITDKENLTSTEEIPSFSEWTQKQLEEAEKKKVHANVSAQNQSINGKASVGKFCVLI